MVTEITMEDMVKGEPPDNHIRIVMFYGATCGPCKATMPNYETVANSFQEKKVSIKFLKINAWEPTEQADFCKQNYNINGVPHFKVFFKGQQILEKIGGGDEPTMRNFINEAIYEALAKLQENV